MGSAFYCQKTSCVVGRGPKWSKLPQFNKGGLCREQHFSVETSYSRRDIRLGTLFGATFGATVLLNSDIKRKRGKTPSPSLLTKSPGLNDNDDI